MRLNRSVPPCTVIPVLIYPDPGAAADWLSKAFAFSVRLRIANHRIQMKAGDGCFTIAEGTVAEQLTCRSGPDRGCQRSLRARAAEWSHHPDRAERPTLRRAPIQCSGLLWPPLGLHRNYRRHRAGRVEWRCVSS